MVEIVDRLEQWSKVELQFAERKKKRVDVEGVKMKRNCYG
jgi:hypothetical protein